MKRHKYFGIPLFIILISSFFIRIEDVVAVSLSTKIKKTTVPFGGRVISTEIPTVECPGIISGGTAPVVLSSNLAGLGQAALGATSQQKTLQKINSIGTGVYRAIPLYTISYSGRDRSGTRKTQPKKGDWILGRQYLLPDLGICQTTLFGGAPFPVVKTDNYGVSQ